MIIVSGRTVSFHVKGSRYREKLIVELELFQKQGIIMAVTEVTGWCAPIMVTPKKDMDHIRMYVDQAKQLCKKGKISMLTPLEAGTDIAA